MVAWLDGARSLTFRSEELVPCTPTGVVARTLCSAISPGTELAAYVGSPPLFPGPQYPRVVGYCNVAEVVAIGEDVKACVAGDLVLTHQSHRSAFVCDQADVLHVVDPAEDPVAASVFYLHVLGYEALLTGRFVRGGRVIVIGLGPIGHAAVATAKAFGCEVAAVSNHGGVDRADAESLAPSTTVVLTTNAWSDYDLALTLVDQRGTIAVVGFPGRESGPPPFNPLATDRFYGKQVSVAAVGAAPTDDLPDHPSVRSQLAEIAVLTRSGVLDARAIVSEVAPWSELGILYERLSVDRGAFVTAALDWQ